MIKNIWVLLGCTLCVACGAGEEKADTLAWGGSDPHLHVAGKVEGESVDFRVEGDAARDLDVLACEREYVAPLTTNGELDRARAEHIEVEISAVVDVRGEPGVIQLEFKQHNLQADAVGAKVRIVPRVDGEEIAGNAMWLDFEMNDSAEQRLVETSAESGSFELHEWTGTPEGGSAVIPDGGTVGGTARASFGIDDELRISFTANCGESQVEAP